ncbi:MAG: dienelactone hydrolase family protein [Gammaproteobacteria bacterium]|nr:dienelactone hydrolase family protein [Gammaproteobacteria bacterium]MDH3429389.1 dienelactone hydrolase family protein [Gammaproteobacteria bacterium]MDH3433279.1 dienelactone hydrolase family protein [Gammaproteobacteria bacterium]
MFKCIFPRCGVILGLASLALFTAACDSGDSGSAEADKAAGRANVDAMTREHAGDTAEPSDAAKIAPRRPVVSERLPYAEVKDELVYGHFVFPADMIEPLPAIVVIHEWWGLNDNIRAMADRLAGEGFIVLAVDLFGGKTATSAGVARQYMSNVVENPDSAVANIRQAIDFLNRTAGAPRVGSLGWCFGGGWSLNVTMLFPDDVHAGVIYYGQVTDDEDRLHAINAPILGIFGAEDKGISVASVRRFEAALERLRKSYEIHIYPGADHAFANPSGKAYNAEAAADAWQRTLEFLNHHLIDDDGEES